MARIPEFFPSIVMITNAPQALAADTTKARQRGHA